MTVSSGRPLPSLARDGTLLPEGWAEVTLDELVVHAIGGEWGEAAAGPGLVRVRVLRGTEFREWRRDKGGTAAVRFIRATRLARRRLEAGDIVVEISGGGPDQPVGRTLLIDEAALAEAGGPLVCSNFCRLLRLHGALDPAFVQLALAEKYQRGEIDEYQTQTTNLRNLDFADFLSGTLLRLPPLAEQSRIVAHAEELLASVHTARERLARLRPILRRFRQSVLAAACSGRLTEDGRERPQPPADRERGAWRAPDLLEVPPVPDGWALVALSDVVARCQYGTSVRAERGVRDGVPVLRMGNIQDGALDLSDLKLIDRRAADLPRYALCRGDVLFNRTNSPELVGKAAVYDTDREAVFASYLVRLTCDERLVVSPYVCAWINSPWGRQWARAVRTDCVSQSNINAAKLMALPLPLPPVAEQREIVRRMEALFLRAEAAERMAVAAARQAGQLTRAILERAVRGELVPTEADLAREEGRDYEPAAELLARVRADREAERRPRLEALPAEPGPPPPVRSGADGPSTEEVLAAFRQVCWGAGPMSEEELLRRAALRLGASGLDLDLRGRLRALLGCAEERRVLARAADSWIGATPKLARYDDLFLLGAVAAVLGPGEGRDRRSLTRAVAAHLGYSQVTAAMRDRMEEVFAEGVRRGLLAGRGSRLQLVPADGTDDPAGQIRR